MFGIGLIEMIILLFLALGAIVGVVVLSGKSSKSRPRDDD